MNTNEIFLNAGLTFGMRNPGNKDNVPADMRSNGDGWILVWIQPTVVELQPKSAFMLNLTFSRIPFVLTGGAFHSIPSVRYAALYVLAGDHLLSHVDKHRLAANTGSAGETGRLEDWKLGRLEDKSKSSVQLQRCQCCPTKTSTRKR